MKFKNINYLIEYMWKFNGEKVYIHFKDKKLANTRFNNLNRCIGDDLEYIKLYECKKVNK